MIRFRSWAGGQLVIFAIALAFTGFLLFLSYRTWNAQFYDEVEIRSIAWQQQIERCRTLSTETCNEQFKPLMDASMRGIVEGYRHREKAAWFKLSVLLIDLLVIPGVLAYMAFHWFGARRRGSV